MPLSIWNSWKLSVTDYYLRRWRTTNVNNSNERKQLYIKKKRKKEADDIPRERLRMYDDLVLPANTSALAKSLLKSLKQTAKSIGLYMNSDKANRALNKIVPPPH